MQRVARIQKLQFDDSYTFICQLALISMAKTRRILHFPTNTGGHPYGLSLQEKNLGLLSHCVTLKPPQFGYKVDYTLYTGHNFLIAEVLKWCFFVFSLFYYNEFHFNYGNKFFTYISPDYRSEPDPVKKIIKFIYSLYSTLFGKLDLFVLKALNKKIIVTFQGDDIRQGDYCRAHYQFHFVNEVSPGYYSAFTDQRKRKLIELYDQYADEIYALNPDLLNILPKRARFLPYKLEGGSAPATAQKPRSVFTIIHAPTDRKVKGTEYILKALEKIKDEGFNFEIKLIENLTHQEALDQYKNADLAIDQIWAGWYGGFAVEAMQFGVPVMAYLRESDLVHLPQDFRNDLPVLNIDPGNLKSSILQHLKSVQSGAVNQEIFKNFVNKWHNVR
ncbi:MAG: glycosyltransferase family 1 protein [Pseudobdellovibrio sp.]